MRSALLSFSLCVSLSPCHLQIVRQNVVKMPKAEYDSWLHNRVSQSQTPKNKVKTLYIIFLISFHNISTSFCSVFIFCYFLLPLLSLVAGVHVFLLSVGQHKQHKSTSVHLGHVGHQYQSYGLGQRW